MSTASARGVTPHLMRGPVPALFRVFPGFRVVARNDGAVYCFGGIETSVFILLFAQIVVPMSTASAVLRHKRIASFRCRLVPMSTASAVLRLLRIDKVETIDKGTYVYCFGGIETIII